MTQESFYHLGDDDAVQRHIKLEREKGKKTTEDSMVENPNPIRGLPFLPAAGRG